MLASLESVIMIMIAIMTIMMIQSTDIDDELTIIMMTDNVRIITMMMTIINY